MLAYQSGDIIAVRGTRLLSRMIETASGFVSHVGLVTSIEPVMVTQAIMPSVATLSLKDTLALVDHAYVLQPLTIPVTDLAAIVAYARSKVGEGYDYLDLLWQAANKISRSQWFTQHLASNKLVICSELVARAFGSRGYAFGVARRSATPAEILNFALDHPSLYVVSPIKA